MSDFAQLVPCLRGRADFLTDRGEVKTPELLREAATVIENLYEALTAMLAAGSAGGWDDPMPGSSADMAERALANARGEREPVKLYFRSGRAWSGVDLEALAAATGTAKTAKQAECEASQSGPNDSEGNAQ